MKRHFTLVLTAAAAAMLCAGKPAAAVSVAPATNLSQYDQPAVTSATGDNGLSAQETAMKAAIDAHRQKLGLPAFQWNDNLSNAARYQLYNEQDFNFTGSFVLLSDGKTKVYPLVLTSDFGVKGLSLVRNAQYGNSTLLSSATNFVKLEDSWDKLSASYDRALKDKTLTQAGFALIQTNTLQIGKKTYPIYTWSFLAAK